MKLSIAAWVQPSCLVPLLMLPESGSTWIHPSTIFANSWIHSWKTKKAMLAYARKKKQNITGMSAFRVLCSFPRKLYITYYIYIGSRQWSGLGFFVTYWFRILHVYIKFSKQYSISVRITLFRVLLFIYFLIQLQLFGACWFWQNSTIQCVFFLFYRNLMIPISYPDW